MIIDLTWQNKRVGERRRPSRTKVSFSILVLWFFRILLREDRDNRHAAATHRNKHFPGARDSGNS